MDIPLIENKKERNIVKYLSWNIDATILVIHFTKYLNEGNVELNNKSFFCFKKEKKKWKYFLVQFWTVSNYNWAQKLEFDFGNESLNSIFWDTEENSRIHILSNNGFYRRIELVENYLCNNGIVGVISGSN